MTLEPIGVVHSPLKSKAEAARQPAAATEATAVPCSSSRPDVVCAFMTVVPGRVANSSCVMSTPADCLNNSPTRCGIEPMPEVE